MKKQQKEVKSLHEQLGIPADLVTIALDIDPNENADTLKTYAADNGFDWRYTVSPRTFPEKSEIYMEICISTHPPHPC